MAGYHERLKAAGARVLVARRSTRNPVGWLLISFILLVMIATCAGYYALLSIAWANKGSRSLR